jgi:BioD-like phosphotransacetylase family protein
MKSLYITSVERYSGKTAVCLGLGKRFQNDGYRVGYLKPLSLQPWMASGRLADEDAAFVKEVLNLPAKPWELSPVVVTTDFLREQLSSQGEINLMEKVKTACEQAGQGEDILLLEGGGSLREGYVVGLPTPAVAKTLSSDVLVIVKYRDEVRVVDDALAAQARLGDTLCGILINRAPEEDLSYVTETVAPYLERHNLPVLGILPERAALAALTVDELTEALGAEVLSPSTRTSPVVENLTVGAMNVEAALSRFRKQTNKAVITGGDRTDIQLAALETSTSCLVLTGNLHPSPLVVKQAKEFGVAVLLVPTNTMETVEKIERIFGKTRLGQPAKLRQFEDLLEAHLDFTRLYRVLDLK